MEYRSFLQSLDDEAFLSHIGSISQSQGRSQEEKRVHDEDQNNTQYQHQYRQEDELDRSELLLGATDAEITQPDVPQSDDVRAISTPLKKNSSVRSDPFDDSFNQALLAEQTHKQEHINVNNVDEVNEVNNEEEHQVNNEEEHQVNNEEEEHQTNNENADDEDADSIGPAHDFGDYGTYFHNKLLKQQKEDEDFRQWDLRRRQAQGEDKGGFKEPIFAGCVIHVNGHTVPSINEIHKLVVIYGGKFLGFLGNKSAATHIVCDRLTPRKQIQFKNCRVVKAQWIVDCITARKLLDWKQYRLFKEIDYDQQRLQFQDYAPDTFAVGQHNLEFLPQDTDEVGLLENENEHELAYGQGSLSEESQIDLKNNHVNATLKNAIMDAKHPQFLEHFFANSRLHHLSIWKADLRLVFLKKILQAGKTKRQVDKSDNTSLILHLDFDCFFATASCQKHPHLDINKHPIAVSHGGKTSDVASCNYVARKSGVKNGMWLGLAKKLCPELIVVDYEFDLYENYASSLYNYLVKMASHFDTIFPVLIDEVLIDATSYVKQHLQLDVPSHVASLCKKMRQDIFNLTNCSVSIGASHNVLLAKIALRQAKPNGYYYFSPDNDKLLKSVPVRSLPGVGYALIDKLRTELSIVHDPSIEDLRKLPKERLKNVFGPKTGEKLYDYARGLDSTSIELDSTSAPSLLGRKSVSVDVNFGIRFDDMFQVETFMMNIGGEVSKRLKKLGLIGSQVGLKLAIRAKDAPVNPPKHLGMGKCYFLNKTARLGIPTDDWGIIGAELKTLTRILNIEPKELRGVAVTITKLEDWEQYKKSKQQKLSSAVLSRTNPKKDYKPVDTSNFKDPIGGGSDIDWEVFDSLPWAIRKEIKDEMFRRGIISRESTPKKSDNKVFLQQLLPFNDDSQPQYVRVVESPKRMKKKSRTSLPQKQGSTTPVPIYEEDVSFDSSILNELPSSVRDEVVEDLNTRKKQKLNPESLRGKFLRIAEKTNMINEPITEVWVSNQKPLTSPPLFLNTEYSYSDMQTMISGWVSESLQQEGPHEDDVAEFVRYLTNLLLQNNLSRCLKLIECIKTELNIFKAVDQVTRNPSRSLAFVEWNRVLDQKIMGIVNSYCNKKKIKIDAIF